VGALKSSGRSIAALDANVPELEMSEFCANIRGLKVKIRIVG